MTTRMLFALRVRSVELLRNSSVSQLLIVIALTPRERPFGVFLRLRLPHDDTLKWLCTETKKGTDAQIVNK